MSISTKIEHVEDAWVNAGGSSSVRIDSALVDAAWLRHRVRHTRDHAHRSAGKSDAARVPENP